MNSPEKKTPPTAPPDSGLSPKQPPGIAPADFVSHGLWGRSTDKLHNEEVIMRNLWGLKSNLLYTKSI